MAQLKSFKFIEPDSAREPDASNPHQQVPQESSLSSSSSKSSFTGPVLTSNDESEEMSVNKSPSQELAKVVASGSSSLASSQECQVASYDIVEEEEEEGSDKRQAESPINKVSQAQEAPASLTSMTAKIKLRVLNQNVPSSPAIGRAGSVQSLGQSRMNDASSQLSVRTSSANQFEIRWHEISVFASKSKVPKMIANSSIYKFFARSPSSSSSDSSDKLNPDNIYYSPPIRHKELAELRPSTPAASTPSGSIAPNPNPAEYRPILSNLSGSVFSAQMSAVLGPSGVGKTMLLNTLTGRNTLEATGKVSLLGGGASKRMSVVTVPQEDVLPSKLTALEDLRFTSHLKNPQRGFNHARNIERIVRHLQLDKFLDTRIDKLSGGEARRLSIGRELLSSPDIMILDEPTSGLDANTCKKIITALRDIVEHSDAILDRPMAVIVTIHQPQREVLDLFHRVYVMARGGRAIYEGPPSNLMPTLLEFSSLSRVCAPDQLNENPAIVALEVASGEYGPDLIGELALHHEQMVYEDQCTLTDDNLAAFPPTTTDKGYSHSPFSTPRVLRLARKSPALSSASPRVDRFYRSRLNSIGENSLGKQTPRLARSRLTGANFDKVSNVTSVSFASSYDLELPEQSPRLKVDKRLRRSVVMKGDFISHTLTLIRRCWLLTTRDAFLMAIRIIGFLLVAGGMVQIFAEALDPNEHQCPVYESEVDDIVSFILSTKNRLMNLQTSLKQSSSTHLFFFHLVLCITMVTSALTGLVFPLQMRMFIREYKNGWYSPASFITSQTLAELPVDMIGPTISLVITYPLCQQPVSAYYWREVGYILVLIIASLICKSQAQIVGALLMNSVENSVFVSCVLVTPPALLSGIAVRVSQMPWLLGVLSYGSFLRYAFESLFVLRYGYDICPCNPDVIDGWPTKTSADAVPPQLDRLARGFIELSQNASPAADLDPRDNFLYVNNGTEPVSSEGVYNNLFLKFLRLVTDASNLFVPNSQDLGTCEKYRSLYLMDMEIEDKILLKWVSIMLFMFILSRFITYYVIKAVIKLRRP